MPSSPAGWVRWSVCVLEAQARPFAVSYDGMPKTDRRLRDSRETALSVKMLLEKVCNGNGAGKLLMDYYLGEMSWYSFTKKEQWLIEKTARRFRAGLVAAGFIPDKG